MKIPRLLEHGVSWPCAAFLFALPVTMAISDPAESRLEQLKYNHAGLVVDLGVGLWADPEPVDYDEDGDLDLLVSTADVPSNGIYFFENPGGDAKFPVFRPGVRLAEGIRDTTISPIGESWVIMTPGKRYPDFKKSGFSNPVAIPYQPAFHTGRDSEWEWIDYDGDTVLDLIIHASDWRDYGWDDAFNDHGEWTRGPLHGYVYFVKNVGTNAAPRYGEAEQLKVGDKPLEVYGTPSPSLSDWDNDGDLDLICGEFLDKFTYFENIGTRSQPRYADGRYLTHDGRVITMDLQMIRPTAIDWDRDGDVDLVVGQEDGRVALLENTGRFVDGAPGFLPGRFFQQQADALKVGALCTPVSADWDGDGDEDLIVGDTAGYLSFVENLDGGNPPRWAKPVYLAADGETIRIQAGRNGSIQGPCEAKWGYTVPEVADWDQDGLPDVMINSIWGAVLWYRNVGRHGEPRLAAAQPVEVEWEGRTPKPEWVWWEPKGKQLVTQWRTSPRVVDWNRDGLIDLVMLDHEGYLAFFERRKGSKGLELLPGRRIFAEESGQPLRLNERRAGKSGRRKFAIADWDMDGDADILIDGINIDLLRNVGTIERPAFRNEGPLDSRKLAGHDTCPTTVDWNRNGVPDLVIGAEDGFFYHLTNPLAVE